MGRGGRGARVSDLFSKNPNLKNIYIFFWGGGGLGGRGDGGLELVNFLFKESKSKKKEKKFTKIPNLKKKIFFSGGRGGGGGGVLGGGGGWRGVRSYS